MLILRIFQLILLSNLFPSGDGQFQKFVCIELCDSPQITKV